MKRSKLFLGLFILAAVCLLFVGMQSKQPTIPDEIERINRDIELYGMNWKAGVTSLTNLSPEEKRKKCGMIWPLYEDPENFIPTEIKPGIPGKFQWNDKGGKNFCPPVDDQGQCGSCWAFGTNSGVEATYNVEKNRWVDAPDTGVAFPNFSEQDLVSCCNPCGDCGGGFVSEACKYWMNPGVVPETCFPYTAANDPCNKCPTWNTKVSRITGWSWVTTTAYNHPAVRTQLYNHAPLIGSMDVYSDFYNYISGVYEKTPGATYEGAHCILIVGYDNTLNCYVCQNSWGTGWGENGYFRIKYGEVETGKWTAKVWGVKTTNKPPVLAAIGPQKGKEGQEMTIQLTATDPDNDTLSYSYTTNTPMSGATLNSDTGEFKWEPDHTQAGVYWVIFKVTDGFIDDFEQVKITIANVKKGKGKF